MDKLAWYQQKTTWAAIAGALTAVGGYCMGEIAMQTLIEALFASTMAVFMRQGVEKSK